ncbi:MAG TPA: ABC transporter permease [Longimicrobiales bacterium]|nr:ABC transporter permease [Longimicrobiales bacterium]
MRGGVGPGRARELVYRILLLGYPASFRRRYREDLLETFGDAWRAEARGRPLAALAFWLRLVRDGLFRGLALRVRRTRAPSGPFEAREAVGPGAVFSGVWRDVRQAARSFRRSPVFTAVVVATLALGIGVTTAVFTVVDSVLLRPLPYDEPGELVRVYMTHVEDPGSREYVTGTHFLAWREGVRSFRHLAPLYTYAETGADVMVGEGAERIRLLQVGADYFEVLRAVPVLGRGFTREEERPDERLAVLSAALWERTFGSDPAAVGAAVVLNGEPYTVVGVMPPGLEDPLVGPVDVWVPHDMQVTENTNQPYNHYLTAIARLEPGVLLERAQTELDGVSLALAERYPDMDEWRAMLVPLREDVVGESRPMLYVLLAAVGLVLLIACVNVANLFLVRSLGRTRELAVRSALGSGGLRLARQLLSESLLLALAGGAAGVAVAWLGVEALGSLAGESLPRMPEPGLDLRIFAFATAVTALTGLAFGLAPAVRLARPDLAAELKERGPSGRGPRMGRLRSALVVTQVALSLMLMTGAGVLVESFQRLSQVELGFRPEGAVTFDVNLPEARYDSLARALLHETLADRLASLPGVTAAGAASRLPGTGRWYSWGTRPLTGPMAGNDDAFIGGDQRVIEGDVFEALGMEVVRGRSFDARDDVAAPRRVVINERAAERLFPGVDPLGQRLAAGGRGAEVIGVVNDAVSSVEGEVRPKIYHHHPQFASNRNWALTYVVRSDAEPMTLLPAIRGVVATLDPQLVVHQPRPLEHVVEQGIAQRRFALALMLAFAGAALALAALGLYAVLAFAVAQRSHEIGVRIALGATSGAIRRMVLGRGLVLAVIGVVLGGVAARALSGWLESLVFEVSPGDPRVLAAVAVLVLGVAAAAGIIPALRATRIEPRSVIEGG